MAVIPRNAQGHGWLRPAIGVVELSQCIIQVMNLSQCKVLLLGHFYFLQLHFYICTKTKELHLTDTFKPLAPLAKGCGDTLIWEWSKFPFSYAFFHHNKNMQSNLIAYNERCM